MSIVANRSQDLALQRFTEKLVKLHELIALDRGETPEADELRDLMEQPWYSLGERESKIAQQVSADLYALFPDSAPPHPPGDAFSPSLAKDLNEARKNNDYLTALELITQRATEIGEYRATNLRGSCYQHLGITDIALLFFERAVDLTANNSGALIYLLTALAGAGEGRAASERANGILQQGTSDIELHRLCALIVLSEARDRNGATSIRQIEYAQSEFERVLERLQISEKDSRTLQSIVECLFSLSECSYLLGDEKKAIQHLSTALRISPNDEPARVLRGLLYTTRDFSLARADFRNAVEYGTQDVWPYYYLAHDALRSEEYDFGLRMASEGLRRTRRPELVSEFHELIAISLFMRHASSAQMPVEEIRTHFSLATAQSPLDLNVSENSRRFEIFTTRQVMPQWQIPKQSEPSVPEMTEGWISRLPSYAALVN